MYRIYHDDIFEAIIYWFTSITRELIDTRLDRWLALALKQNQCHPFLRLNMWKYVLFIAYSRHMSSVRLTRHTPYNFYTRHSSVHYSGSVTWPQCIQSQTVGQLHLRPYILLKSSSTIEQLQTQHLSRHTFAKRFANMSATLVALICICLVALSMGFAPVARKAFPVMINNVKQFRSSSQGSNSNSFRLFADNDGKKITRDKEGEFFESSVSLHDNMVKKRRT